MKALKDIFVTYEIAQKLKEIGFDERCIAFYTEDKEIYSCIQREETKGQYISGKLVGNMYRDVTLNAPTWEQVFKWFREKGFYGNVHKVERVEKVFLFTINKLIRIYESDILETYEQAQEVMIYKLIEIYKNEKN